MVEGQFPPGNPVAGRPDPELRPLPLLFPVRPDCVLLPLLLLMMNSLFDLPEVAGRSVFHELASVADRVWKNGCCRRGASPLHNLQRRVGVEREGFKRCRALA